MNLDSKIFVAGHNGMVGSAIVRNLTQKGYTNIITYGHEQLDLMNQIAVQEFFDTQKPEYVFLCAAKVGGILANFEQPADFMYNNMMIEMNVIHSAFVSKVKKLLFLGSSCIYPKDAPQPIKEEYLLSSPLEQTNEGYALAKISGLKYCEYLNRQYGTNYISCMPTNLYGQNDHYDLHNSHVVPALIRKFHEAKQNKQESVICWGDGSPLREFMFVDDMADACVFLMNNYNDSQTINVGTGKDMSIKQLAQTIALVVGYNGRIEWDTTKPNGVKRKLLDISKLSSLGWESKYSLLEGLQITYQDYKKSLQQKGNQ